MREKEKAISYFFSFFQIPNSYLKYQPSLNRKFAPGPGFSGDSQDKDLVSKCFCFSDLFCLQDYHQLGWGMGEKLNNFLSRTRGEDSFVCKAWPFWTWRMESNFGTENERTHTRLYPLETKWKLSSFPRSPLRHSLDLQIKTFTNLLLQPTHTHTHNVSHLNSLIVGAAARRCQVSETSKWWWWWWSKVPLIPILWF